MAMFPKNQAKECAIILEHFELETIGDVLTASDDTEVEEYVQTCSTETCASWNKLVEWARVKHGHSLDRITRAAASGSAPRMRWDAGGQPKPPPAKAQAEQAQLPASKKRRGANVEEKEMTQRRKAAARILEIVREAGSRSRLAAEFEEENRLEWESSYLETLTGGETQAGFEHRTLQKAGAAWKRWSGWQKGQSKQDTPFEPTPVLLSAFFKAISKRGPTAAQGVFTSFEWLRKHAGLELLPLKASVVEHYRHPHAGHLPAQQPPLSITGFGALLGKLQGDASPWVKCAAALVLRVTLSGLRLAHVARASKVEADSTPRTAVWRIRRGKGSDRGGFKTATPTHVAPGLCLDTLISSLGPDKAEFMDYLLPDLRIGEDGLEGKCSFVEGRMTRSKFLDIASWLLQDIESTKVTGYTFRRFLPTAADALQFSLERRQCLGNWVDAVADKSGQKAKEPMAVRYSQVRLENTAQLKRVCAAAVTHVYSWTRQEEDQATWEQVSGCVKSLPTLEENTRRSKWGTHQISGDSGAVPPAAQIEVSSDEESSSSSGTSTSSSSSTDGTDDDHHAPPPHPMLKMVRWIAPSRSKRVHIQRTTDMPVEEQSVMPLCRARPYAAAYTSGTGIEGASKLGYPWCGTCLRMLEQEHPLEDLGLDAE